MSYEVPKEVWKKPPGAAAVLEELCEYFIKKHKITCADTIYQSDDVIEGAFDLIEDICNIVGYYKEEDV